MRVLVCETVIWHYNIHLFLNALSPYTNKLLILHQSSLFYAFIFDHFIKAKDFLNLHLVSFIMGNERCSYWSFSLLQCKMRIEARTRRCYWTESHEMREENINKGYSKFQVCLQAHICWTFTLPYLPYYTVTTLIYWHHIRLRLIITCASFIKLHV